MTLRRRTRLERPVVAKGKVIATPMPTTTSTVTARKKPVYRLTGTSWATWPRQDGDAPWGQGWVLSLRLWVIGSKVYDYTQEVE